MALVNQYNKNPQKTIRSIDYFCGLFALSTFITLCIRGLILSYRGFLSIIIWIWLLVLLVYLIKISFEILENDFFYNIFSKTRLRHILVYNHLNILVLILTSLILIGMLLKLS